MPDLKKTQQAFKSLLLVQGQESAPDALVGIPKERLSIYQGLLCGTVSSCLAGIYPHTKAFLEAQSIRWNPLVEQFRREHPNPSYMLLYAVEHWPAFLSKQEFSKSWPWLSEIAMYEWQEALMQNLPDTPVPVSMQKQLPDKNVLAANRPLWNTASVLYGFSFPVTRILEKLVAGNYKTIPSDPLETTNVLIYRDMENHKARFFVLNGLTANLLSALTPDKTYAEGFDRLIAETPPLQSMPKETVIEEGIKLLAHCEAQGILLGSVPV